MMQKLIQMPNIGALTRKYEGKWVALSSDYKKVLASGDTLSGTLKKVSGEDRAVVFRVLPGLGYAPNVIE